MEKRKTIQKEHRREVWKSAVGGARLDRLSDDLGISRDLEPGDEFAAVRQRKKRKEGTRKTTPGPPQHRAAFIVPFIFLSS